MNGKHEIDVNCSKCGAPMRLHTELDISDPETNRIVLKMLRLVKCDRCAFPKSVPKINERPAEPIERNLPYKDE